MTAKRTIETRECKYWKLDKNKQLMLCVITYKMPVKKSKKI